MKSRKMVALLLGMLVLAQTSVVAASPQVNQTSNSESVADQSDKYIADTTIVAKVGDLGITAQEVRRQLNYECLVMQYQYQLDESDFQTPEMQQYIGVRKGEIVDELIKNKIAYSKGKTLKLEPTEVAIQAEYEDIQKSYKSPDAFYKDIVANGYTEASYKAEIKENLTINNLIQYITSQIKISEDEIKAYYKANIESYKVGAGANMAHILVDTEEQAKVVKAQYDRGKSFEVLAEKYGTDGTRNTGGALGYIPYNSTNYDQDFLNGAKDLKEGMVSEPVQTRFGWHLIKVTNVHQEGYTRTLEEVKEEIKTLLIAMKQNQKVNATMTEWEKEVKIEKNEVVISAL